MLTEAELSAMQAAFIRVNDKAIIQTINPYGAHMFGYTDAELIGKPLSVLIPPIDQPRQARGFQQAMVSAEYHSSSFIVNAQHKDGKVFVIWHKVGKCVDDKGLVYFVALAFNMASPGVRF